MEKYMSKNYMSYKEAALKDWYLVHTRDDEGDSQGERLVKISFENGKTYNYESNFWDYISTDDVVVLRNGWYDDETEGEMGRFNGRVFEFDEDEFEHDEVRMDACRGEIWHAYKINKHKTDDWCKNNCITGSDIKDIMHRMCNNMIAISLYCYDYDAELTIVEDAITDVILYSNVLAFRDLFEADIVEGAEEYLSKPRRLCTDIFETKFTNMLRLIQSEKIQSSQKYDALFYAAKTWDEHDDNYVEDFKKYETDSIYVDNHCYDDEEDDDYDDDDDKDNDAGEDHTCHSFLCKGCYPGWQDQFQSLSILTELDKYEDYVSYGTSAIAIYKGNEKIAALFREDKEFCDFYNELVYRSAISLLIRGGFVNLLKALLSAKPPIDGFIDKLCDFAKKLGSTYCLDVLEKYKSGDENGLKTDLATTEAEKFVYSELAKITPDDKRELFRKILTGWHVAAVEKVDKIDFNGKLFCMPGRNPLMIRNCVSSRGGTYTYELRSSADYVIVDTDTLSNYHNCHKAWEWKFDGRTEWIRIISLKQFYEMCGITPPESTGDIKPRTEMTISEFFEKRLPEMLVKVRRAELSGSDYRSNRLTDLVGRIPRPERDDLIIIVDSVENYAPFLPNQKEYYSDLCGIGTDSPIVPEPVDTQNKDEKKSVPVPPAPESDPISEEPTYDEPSAEEETEPAPEPVAEPAPETEAPCGPESSMIPADAEGEPLSASGMSFTEALGAEWFVVTPAGKKFRKQCIVFPDGRRCEFNTQYDHTPEDVVVMGGDGKYFGMIGRPDFSGAPVTEYDTDGRVRFVFRKDPTEEDVRKMSRRLTSLSDSDASMKRYISERVGDEDVVVDIVNDYIERELIACALVNNRFASEKLRSKASSETHDDKNCGLRMVGDYLDEVNGKEEKRTGQKSGVVIKFNGYFSGWEKERDSLDAWAKLSKKRGCEAVPGKLRLTELTLAIAEICWDDGPFDRYYGSLIFKSALSIIVRCGFANLLQGALNSGRYDEQNEFRTQFNSVIGYIRGLARSTGSKYCGEMIEAYMRGEESNIAYKSISVKHAALTLGVDWKKLFKKKLNAKKLKGVEFSKGPYYFKADTFCVAGFDGETTKKIEEYLIKHGQKMEEPEDVYMMFMDYLVINEYAEKIPEEYEMWLERKSEGKRHLAKVISLEILCDMLGWDLDCYWEV